MVVQSPFHRVYIRAKAKKMLDTWVAMADKEISFLGLVEDTDDGPCITELFLPKQKNTGTHTDMDDNAVMALMVKLAQEGNGREGQLRAWVHSHVNMACMWSDTDHNTMNLLKNPKYTVSIVVNKKGEYRCRIDIYEPYHIWFDEVPVLTYIPKYDVKEECERLFKANVTEGYAFTPTAMGGQGQYDYTQNRGTAQGTATPNRTTGGGYYVDGRWVPNGTHSRPTTEPVCRTGGAGSGVEVSRVKKDDKRFPKEVKGVVYESEDDAEEGVMTGKITIEDYTQLMYPALAQSASVQDLGGEPVAKEDGKDAKDVGVTEGAP